MQRLDRHRLAVGEPKRLITRIGSDGDTCSEPAEPGPGEVVSSESVRLPGTIPRRRMSSLNEVMVSSCEIFGCWTYVPLPRRRTR